MRRGAALVLAGSFLAAAAALGFVAVRGQAPATSIPDRVHAIASTLRCPVCQDLSVADSPSLAAREMRAAIATRLRAGQSPGRVTAYFVSRFGPSIMLTPSAHGVDLVSWILPGLLAAAGVAILALALVRWTRAETAAQLPAPTEADRSLLEHELHMLGSEET